MVIIIALKVNQSFMCGSKPSISGAISAGVLGRPAWCCDHLFQKGRRSHTERPKHSFGDQRRQDRKPGPYDLQVALRIPQLCQGVQCQYVRLVRLQQSCAPLLLKSIEKSKRLLAGGAAAWHLANSRTAPGEEGHVRQPHIYCRCILHYFQWMIWPKLSACEDQKLVVSPMSFQCYGA